MRRDAKMHYRRRTIVASVAIVAGSILAGGLAHHTSGATLSERLSAFGKAFKSDGSASQSQQADTQQRRSGSAVPSNRNNRSSYARSRQRNYSRNRASQQASSNNQPKGGLSSLLPQNLFSKKQSSQQRTNERSQQQRQQQMQQQARRSNSAQRPQQQVVQQRPQPKQQERSPQIVVEDTQTAKQSRRADQVRRSPQISRREDFSDTLTELTSTDMTPGSAVAEPGEVQLSESALVTDDYNDYYVGEIEEEQITATDTVEAELVVETEEVVASEELFVEPQDIAEPTTDSIVQDDTAFDVSPDAFTDQFATSGAASPELDFQEVESSTVPELLVEETSTEDVVAEVPGESYSVQAESEPVKEVHVDEVRSEQLASTPAPADVPFGHPQIDVHDALLSSDLYAVEAEAEAEEATESIQVAEIPVATIPLETAAETIR